ncbi:MAG: hypothetical protein H6699_08580 [Myxococcales bacterium]|nr:hypothetical protein [Myxococcales bacterium]
MWVRPTSGSPFLLSLYGVVQWDVIGFPGRQTGLEPEYYEGSVWFR